MLLLGDEIGDAAGKVVIECLERVLELGPVRRGRAGGHRRRQVDEPARIDREAAHDLERGERVLLRYRHRPTEAALDTELLGEVVEVEESVVVLLRARATDRLDRAGRDGVLLARGYRDDLPFGPAQRGELPAEHASRIDAERVVEPLGVGYRRVPEHDGGLPPVVAATNRA